MNFTIQQMGNGCQTFEFERQSIAGWCKQTFHFEFNIKPSQSQTCLFSVFSVPCLIGAKIPKYCEVILSNGTTGALPLTINDLPYL